MKRGRTEAVLSAGGDGGVRKEKSARGGFPWRSCFLRASVSAHASGRAGPVGGRPNHIIVNRLHRFMHDA